MPQMPITEPRLCGGNMSIMIVCDSGPNAAPKAPCIRRKTMIWSRFCAMPHSADVIVKPPTATMMKRRLPKRDAIQPTGAVMIADAMMYDVSTHVI